MQNFIDFFKFKNLILIFLVISTRHFQTSMNLSTRRIFTKSIVSTRQSTIVITFQATWEKAFTEFCHLSWNNFHPSSDTLTHISHFIHLHFLWHIEWIFLAAAPAVIAMLWNENSYSLVSHSEEFYAVASSHPIPS